MKKPYFVLEEVFGRLMAIVLLPMLRLTKYWSGRGKKFGGIWIIGENQGDCVQDNGYAFYRYCREFHPEKRVFFLLKSSSPFYSNEFRDDKYVIPYGSIAHMKCFINSDLLFYTHTYRDLMYRRFFEVYNGRRRMVYLHHGSLGFKKFDPFYYRNRNIMEVFTSGSSLEKKILVELAGVSEARVKLTGFARGDLLGQSQCDTSRQLLYMPTHRRHLKGKDKVEFVEKLDSLLRNPRLIDLLDCHDLTLNVYLHAHAQKTLSYQGEDHPRIQMVTLGAESVRDLLCSSMLLITDYSSVCWDFLTLGKPVVFYRFDIENYAANRDSYIDLRDESYGEIAYDEGRLLELLSQYLESGCLLRKGVADSIGAVVSRDGRSNCDRIFELSEELGSAGQPS